MRFISCSSGNGDNVIDDELKVYSSANHRRTTRKTMTHKLKARREKTKACRSSSTVLLPDHLATLRVAKPLHYFAPRYAPICGRSIVRINRTLIALTHVSIFVTLCANCTFTQVSLNTVAARVGAINGFLTSRMVFYPELQAGGQLGLPFFNWSAYWGHWDDAITDATITDGTVFSSRGHTLGLRVAFDPARAVEHSGLPVLLFGGYSHQIISATYIAGYNEFSGKEYFGPTSTNSIEAGVAAYLNIISSLQLCVQAQHFFVLYDGNWDRRAYTIGLNYGF